MSASRVSSAWALESVDLALTLDEENRLLRALVLELLAQREFRSFALAELERRFGPSGATTRPSAMRWLQRPTAGQLQCQRPFR